MGLFICDICNEELGSEAHVCNPEQIRKYVHQLHETARLAERRLDEIQSAVFMALQSLPSLESEQVLIETKWLRKLWKAAECQWYKAETPENFLIRWLAMHRILCEAFDVFRSKKYGKTETLLEKLNSLREVCDGAKKILGYEDSNFDLTPEDLVKP